MALPPNADADPDPTTQIPWPGKSSKRVRVDTTNAAEPTTEQSSRSQSIARKDAAKKATDPTKRRMSTMDLFNISISMAGAQVAWTVELGYGTPFLLSLGLSEQLISLVWLAGPISGLVAQPLIGAISDASTSKYRRRYWIVTSTIVLVISTFTLAYCKELAAFFVDLVGAGEGSWDPKRNKVVLNTAIAFAVVSFYLLDFSLNALQASLRNLLLDITPPEQLNEGNAWHSRMLNAGNIIGYGSGFFPLDKVPVLRLLGGAQFRKFCVVSIFCLVTTVGITCWTQEETPRTSNRVERDRTKFTDFVKNIYKAAVSLPKPIRRVCYVQIFAFMGWFPFLFYSTTYVAQVLAFEQKTDPDTDTAARMGNLAMLIYSLVAVIAGTVLPPLARRDTRLLAHEGDEDEDAELTRLKMTVREWRAEAARQGRPLRLPFMPFFLRNIWTGALLLFTILMFLTLFISTMWQAIVVVSLVGICWAVACWVPFAIIMEFLKEKEGDQRPPEPRQISRRPSHNRTRSMPASRLTMTMNENAPLLRRRTSFDENDTVERIEGEPAAGGTIMGIHNLAIVAPQFIISLVASAIFRAADGEMEDDPSQPTFYGKTGVAWVLRFGGLCTLAGALIARMVPPTRTEKEMRRRLAELKVLQKESSP